MHAIFKNLLQFQSWNDYVYQDNEEENSDASFSSDWGQYEYEYQGISSVSQRYTVYISIIVLIDIRHIFLSTPF